MNMHPSYLFALGGLAVLLGPVSSASAAVPFQETFSVAGSTAGWTALSTNPAAAATQNPGAGVLAYSTADYSSLFLIADAGASGGAFVGNFIDGEIGKISFDLVIDTGSAVSGLFVSLANFGSVSPEEWRFSLALPTFDARTTYTVPLPTDGAGWTQISGSGSFASLLANTEEFSILLENTAVNGSGAPVGPASGSLDNVTSLAVPEPAANVLLAVAGLGAGLWWRRARRGVPSSAHSV